MAVNDDNTVCKGCSETLTIFLREMAEHNAEVACPECGKVYTRSEAAAAKAVCDAASKRSPS
jgi:uncharacterized Zn-finger protein